jgi:hypothetical protein
MIYQVNKKITVEQISSLLRYGLMGSLMIAILHAAIIWSLNYTLVDTADSNSFFSHHFFNIGCAMKIVSPLIFGLLVGVFAVGGRVNLGIVKNRILIILGGFTFGLLSIYFSWIFWIIIDSGFKTITALPSSLIHYLIQISKTHIWHTITYETITIPSKYIQITWIIEAVIVIISSVVGSLYMVDKNGILCPNCKLWVKNKNSYNNLTYYELEDIIDKYRLAISVHNYERKSVFSIEILSCFCCKDFHLLTIKKDKEFVVNKLILSNITCTKLSNLLNECNQTAKNNTNARHTH